MNTQGQDPEALERELKAVLRSIESAKVSVANELGKGGNLPYAYSQLQDAEHKLTRVMRTLK